MLVYMHDNPAVERVHFAPPLPVVREDSTFRPLPLIDDYWL